MSDNGTTNEPRRVSFPPHHKLYMLKYGTAGGMMKNAAWLAFPLAAEDEKPKYASHSNWSHVVALVARDLEAYGYRVVSVTPPHNRTDGEGLLVLVKGGAP